MGLLRQLFVRFLPGAGLNQSLRILIALNVIFTFIIGVFAPFYAIFVQQIGGTVAFAGISWGIFTIVSGVLMLLFVRWELRVREQELLLALGYLLRAIVFVSYAYMSSIPQLLLTQVLWGVAAAIGVPAFAALYSAHTSKERSIGEWGGLEGLSSIASGFAALSGGFIIQIFGFQVMFFGMAFVSFALALYIWVLPRQVL